MSNHQAIVTSYNQQALQSSQLIFRAIGSKANHLKNELPNGRIVIEIAIETEEGEGRVHRVAAIAMENNTPFVGEGKLQVNVSVHKYEELAPAPPRENLCDAPSPSSTKVLATKSHTLAVSQAKVATPIYHKIADQAGMEALEGLAEYHKLTSAWQIVKLLQEKIFPNGVPLPHYARVMKCHLIVMTYTHKLLDGMRVEWLATHDKFDYFEGKVYRFPAPSGGCTSERGCSTQSASNPGETKMISPGKGSPYPFWSQRFEALTEVAKGNRLPSSIPTHAIGASASAVVLIEDDSKKLSSAGEPPTVEELD